MNDQVPENQYRCESCGRWFDLKEDLALHQPECNAAEHTGRTDRPRASEEKDTGKDRVWRPVP